MVKLNFLDKYDQRLQSITLIHSVFQVIINLIGSITALKVLLLFYDKKCRVPYKYFMMENLKRIPFFSDFHKMVKNVKEPN